MTDCSLGKPTMKFPVFTSDQFSPCWAHLSSGRGGSFIPSQMPRACPAHSSAATSWPKTAAAFIPLVLGPGAAAAAHKNSARHQSPTSGTSRRVPSCCAAGSSSSRPVIDDALQTAQELLGDLFNVAQPDSETVCACSGCHSPKPSGRPVSKDSSSGCSSKEKCSGKPSTTSSPTNRQKASKDSSGEKKTTDSASTKVMADKNSDQNPKSAAAENDCGDQHGGGASCSLLWTHSLRLPGFAPNEIHLKVKDGKVHIHARHEESSGPGTCLSRLEMLQTVPLPENVDQQKLGCFLQSDGTLLLRAPRATELCSQNKASTTDASENDISKEAGPMESNAERSENKVERLAEDAGNKAENVEALEDKSPRMEALDNKGENMGALENKADNTEALEDKSPRMEALENKGENLRALENQADQVEALTFWTERKTGAPDSQHDAVPADTDTNEKDETPAEEGNAESPLAEAEHAANFLTKSLKEMAGETLVEKSLPVTVEAEEKTDADESASKVLESEDTEQEPTTEKQGDPEVSCPIIQEPEEDLSSGEDEDGEQIHIRKLSTSTGDGDFEVIVDCFVPVSTNLDDMELLSDKHEQTADAVGTEERPSSHTAGTNTSPNDTDPTPPIKRGSDAERAADDNIGNVEYRDNLENSNTPSEGTGSTHDEHSTESAGGQDARSADTEHGDAFLVSLPLMGFAPGDIRVKLEGHTLSIEAQRQTWLADAAYSESVNRRLDLPSHLDMSTVRCVYEDRGYLVITARPEGDYRQVPVEFASQ